MLKYLEGSRVQLEPETLFRVQDWMPDQDGAFPVCASHLSEKEFLSAEMLWMVQRYWHRAVCGKRVQTGLPVEFEFACSIAVVGTGDGSFFFLTVPLHQVVLWKSERTLFSCSLHWFPAPPQRWFLTQMIGWQWPQNQKQLLETSSFWQADDAQVHTHTHTDRAHTLFSSLTPRLPVGSQSGGRAEVNQGANTFWDVLSCPCVALKGFVGFGSKLSKPTKWVARCREEPLRFTRQDSLCGLYYFTLCHAPGERWANARLAHSHLKHPVIYCLFRISTKIQLLLQ